jgi:hypothetical protein
MKMEAQWVTFIHQRMMLAPQKKTDDQRSIKTCQLHVAWVHRPKHSNHC